MKKLLVKNLDINLERDDIFCFGGHNGVNHFFLLLMIPKAKEFLIINPLDKSDTLDCAAKVITWFNICFGCKKQAQRRLMQQKTTRQNAK